MQYLFRPKVRQRIAFVLPGPARIPYHVSTITSLLDLGVDVILVLQKHTADRSELEDGALQLETYLDDLYAGYDNLEIVVDHKKDALISLESFFLSRVRRDLELVRGYSSYLSRNGRDNYYSKRWFGYLPESTQRLLSVSLVSRLAAGRVTRTILSWLAGALPSDASIRAWLRDASISAVVVSPGNSRNPEEVEYLYAARSAGIPSAVAILSWDNLTTKGMVPKVADRYLAWNEFHRRALIDFHGISDDRIRVTGSPFFDKWLDGLNGGSGNGGAERGEDRSRERYILYLGSSGNIVSDEVAVIRELAAILAGENQGAKRLIVRFHPSSASQVDGLKDIENVRLVPSGIPYTADLIQELRSQIEGCDCVVGINTTAMIDAIILGKPCFTIHTEGCHDTHFGADHFKTLIDSGVLYDASDPMDMVAQYRRVIGHGEDTTKPARARFLQDFVRPSGLHRSAGSCAAEAIIELADGGSSVG